MKLTFLGTGTSIGVPAIGCTCEVCRSSDPHDKRLRTSAILETDKGLRVLIDCGPDFRQQILSQPFGKIDAVLLTHEHYDHVGGMDDLRPFGWFGDLDIFAQQSVIDTLHVTMPYCFKEKLYPGVPHLKLHEIRAGEKITITRPHDIDFVLPRSGARLDGTLIEDGVHYHFPAIDEQMEVLPIRVMHGSLPILGFRIGRFAYITDMKTIEPEQQEMLQGVETLVVNALRFAPEHFSHQLVDEAVEFSRSVGAKKTYLVHVTHDIGTHDIANSRLPEGVAFPYDGQVIVV